MPTFSRTRFCAFNPTPQYFPLKHFKTGNAGGDTRFPFCASKHFFGRRILHFFLFLNSATNQKYIKNKRGNKRREVYLWFTNFLVVREREL